jgi:Glycosyltransferase family 87
MLVPPERPSTPSPRRASVLLIWLLWLGVAALLFCFVCLTVSAATQGRHKDFREFYLAAEAMREGRDIYTVGVDGYIYPPLLAFLLLPMVPLGLYAATYLWLASNVVLLLASAVLGAQELRRRWSLEADPLLITAAVALALVLDADKLHVEFVFGQSNLWMLLAWVLGLRWLDRRPVAAGMALGLAANLKYLTLAAVPYMIFRRRYRAAASTMGGAVFGAILPALWLGWNGNLLCWSKALHGLAAMLVPNLAQAGDARVINVRAEMSYSITSAIVRVAGDAGVNLYSVALLLVVLAAFAFAIFRMYGSTGFRVRRPRGTRPEDEAGLVGLEWVGLVAAVLAFGPQTNSRHLSMLVIVFLAGALLALSRNLRARRAPVIAGMVLLVCGLTLPPPSWDRWMLHAWRVAGGVGWCIMIMYMTVLWVGLRHLASSKRTRVIRLDLPIGGQNAEPQRPAAQSVGAAV